MWVMLGCATTMEAFDSEKVVESVNNALLHWKKKMKSNIVEIVFENLRINNCGSK